MTVAVIGSAFQIGWQLAVTNTPSEVNKMSLTIKTCQLFCFSKYDSFLKILKNFYNATNFHRFNQSLSNDELKVLWSVTNGLLQAGAVVGALFSGISAESFGR